MLQAFNPQDDANMNGHLLKSIPAEPQLWAQGRRTTEMLGQLLPAARMLWPLYNCAIQHLSQSGATVVLGMRMETLGHFKTIWSELIIQLMDTLHKEERILL